MQDSWRPVDLPRLPPLPRRGREELAYARELLTGPRRFKLFGDVVRLAERPGSRAHSVSSRRSPRSEAPSKRATSSKTLRAVRAVYQVESRPASPESAQGLELGGQEAEERRELLIRQEVRQMKTGEDAVAYFTRHGANTKLKLIHCVSAPCGGPYDLIVTSEEPRKDMEYFTISPSGVVHVVPSALSDCLSLSQWVHQCMMYRVLKSMALFRLHPHRKSLLQWRRNARDAAYCRHRGALQRACLWTRPMLLPPMLRLKALTSEVGAVPMLQLPERCMRLEDFKACVADTDAKRQDLEWRHQAVGEALEDLTSGIRDAMDRLSKASRRAAVRKRSVAQEKLEAKQRLRMEQALQEDEAAVGSCIRLASCMWQANLASSVNQAAQELYARVAGSKRLFAITVLLGREEVHLEPVEEDLLEAFRRAYEVPIALASSLPPLREADGQATFEAQVHVEKGVAKLRQHLKEARRVASETYGAYREIFEYKTRWKKEAYAEQTHSIESLSREVEVMLQFKELLSKFRLQRPVGVLLLEGRELRDALQPVPGMVLAAIWPLLQATVRGQAERLNGRLEALNRQLDQRPSGTGLEAYGRALEVADREEAALEAAVDELQAAQRLLRRHGQRSLPNDSLQMDHLLSQLREFSSASLPAGKGFLARARREQFQVLAALEMVEERLNSSAPRCTERR